MKELTGRITPRTKQSIWPLASSVSERIRRSAFDDFDLHGARLRGGEGGGRERREGAGVTRRAGARRSSAANRLTTKLFKSGIFSNASLRSRSVGVSSCGSRCGGPRFPPVTSQSAAAAVLLLLSLAVPVVVVVVPVVLPRGCAVYSRASVPHSQHLTPAPARLPAPRQHQHRHRHQHQH